jgi:hypothetical protein
MAQELETPPAAGRRSEMVIAAASGDASEFRPNGPAPQAPSVPPPAARALTQPPAQAQRAIAYRERGNRTLTRFWTARARRSRAMYCGAGGAP